MKRKRRLWWTLACGLIGCLLTVIMIFPMISTRHRSPHNWCLSHVKQLGTAALLYANDNDERLPQADWMESTWASVKSNEVYNCPIVISERKKFGYAMNLATIGSDIFTMVEPGKVVLFFDTDALNRNVVANLAAMSYSRHNGNCTVVRADSSAKRIRNPSLPAKP